MSDHKEHAKTILSFYKSSIAAGHDEANAMEKALKMYDDIKFNRKMHHNEQR